MKCTDFANSRYSMYQRQVREATSTDPQRVESVRFCLSSVLCAYT